jgi:cell division protease FtsH
MDPDGRWTRDQMSPAALEAADRRIREILEEGRKRAAAILSENRAVVESLRDMLIEKRVIEAKTLVGMMGGLTGKKVSTNENAFIPIS